MLKFHCASVCYGVSKGSMLTRKLDGYHACQYRILNDARAISHVKARKSELG